MSSRFTAPIFCAAVLLHATASRAGDTDDIQSILGESLITTASTTAQQASTAPATSTTITAAEFETYGIRTLAEAIDFLSMGVVTQDPLRTPDIGARGVLLPGDDGKHFLLLVDGHAINDPLYGAARFDQGAGIPIDVIDHVEIIVGPGSVLYGSNAMLGVINVITKNASNYRGLHVLGGYEPARSADVGAGAGFTFKAFGAPAELTTSVEYWNRFGPDLHFDERQFPRSVTTNQFQRFRRNGPQDGVWGGALRDAYFAEAPSGTLRLRIGDFDISLLASAYRRGIPYTTGALNVDFDDRDSYEMDRAVRFDVKHQATVSSLVQLTSRVYGDSFDYQRQVNRDAEACLKSSFATCEYYNAGLARWIGVEEQLSLNWFEDLSMVTLLGVDARMRWVSAKEDALDFDTGEVFAPPAERLHDSAGIISPYVQQTWTPARWLDLNAGARLDADERFSPILSPRGALAVTPFPKTTWKAIYSQAFRAPTWNETDFANTHQARSNGLRPEKVRSLEGVLEQRVSTQRVLFGVFRTWWDDLVEARLLTRQEQSDLQARGELPITANGTVQYRNVSSLDNYGWNGGWSGTLTNGKLGYGVNGTAAFSRRKTGDTSQELAASPRVFGNAHIAYAFGKDIPTPAVAAYYVGPQVVDRGFVGGYALPPRAPPLVTIRLTLSGRVPGIRGLGYRASAAYTTATSGPYVAGPTAEPVVLVPIDQFQAFFSLRYDFLTGSDASVAEDSQ